MDMVEIDRSIEKAVAHSFVVVSGQKLVLLFVSLITFCGAAFAILSLQPVYEGSTLLLSGQSSLEPSSAGLRSSPENAAALIHIAQSDAVLRAAIAVAGPSTLTAPAMAEGMPLVARLRARLFGPDARAERVPTALEAELSEVKARLFVRSEPNSGVIQIAFRDADPARAAQVADAVAQAFVDRQIAISSRPGAVEFFRQQSARFDIEVRRASDALERFSVESGLYSVDQQRELLLRRLNELSGAMATNRSSIADKLGQRQAFAEQLRRLSPVARSPYVSSLVDALGGERAGGAARLGEARDTDRASDPPLLLVRVYQDSMVSLFKINADLLGAQNLLVAQEREQARLTAELNTLSGKAEQSERLKRDMAQAIFNAETYARRMVEEQIEAELHAARFSSVKVLQKANEATRPAFPNYKLLLPAAAVFSLALGLGLAMLSGRRQ